MSIDLTTVYALLFGTLGVSTALTFWERRFHPRRSDVLNMLTLGYLAFIFGSAFMAFPILPSPYQRAPAFLLTIAGYGTMLHAVLRLNGQVLPRFTPIAALPLALFCFVVFPRISYETWSLFCSFSITLVSAGAALTLIRGAAFRTLRSRIPAFGVFAFHTLFYGARVAIFAVDDSKNSPLFFATLARVTMFEGVLFAIAAPMLLLSLVREEGEARILTASQTDHLTGLANRRALFEHSAKRLQEAEAAGEAVSVLMFDLDHFKRINDTHGHQVGDEVLRLFGSVLKGELRGQDLSARFGGEEFVAVVVGRSLEDAREDAQRIARRFTREVSGLNGRAIQATVSIGLAHGKPRADALERLLREADGALYRAKALGRNRIEQAPVLAAVA
ncbi:GGDEF domain-containing protein [Aureimonas ureilytica]|uniref:GGDEF domain-containing protein n=1 Tax=Aureimonas ureilytica TaxID=401562 RepID=UPI00035EDCBE|nr:GGDEF domain-containing protein [Aureimonas ureilytica]